MKRLLFFCSLLLFTTAVNAQFRSEVVLGSSINLKKRWKSGGQKDSRRIHTLGNYSADISFYTDKNKTVNWGAGVRFDTYHFSLTNEYNGFLNISGNNTFTYNGQFIALYPAVDISLGKKKRLHLRTSIPVSYPLATKRTYYSYSNNNGNIREGTSSSENDLKKLMFQFSVHATGNIPLKTKRFYLVLDAGYTVTFDKLTQDFNTNNRIRPSQVSFGIGMGYRYAKSGKTASKKV